MRRRLFILFSIFLVSSISVYAQQKNDKAKANQLGFYPDAPKIAITPTTSATTFYIKEAESGNLVYQGELEAGGYYQHSGENVKIADFSDFTRQGSYVLGIDGGGSSFPFEIGNNVYETLNDALIKAMYYNRASIELSDEHAGKWHRSAGHNDTNVLIHSSAATTSRPAGSSISSPGGWYDAGDFNKYVVPISSSINQMLFAYESFPEFFNTRSLNIPESDNVVPDVLDEAKYALDWLFTMQDPEDGGVYHKLTHANFQGTVMPHLANNPRYVVQKGTAATLDFAAVMAQAARVYETYFPDFADTALKASKEAYSWALANPNVSYDQNSMNSNHDPDINTGAYGDGNFSDEFFWARAELYITTGDDQYYPDNGWNGVGIPGWPNVQALGLFSLLHHRENLTVAGLADTVAMKNALISGFQSYVNNAPNVPYRSPFGIHSWQFGWGSNGGAGNLGMGVMIAYQLTGEQKYYDGAIAIMDYLMGRNPVAYSYVTGFGDQSPMHIHHRQSEADNVVEPVPGWVAGGANANNQSQDCGTAAYNSTFPALSFLDSYCSYSTNEITTYWNSPFVYLTAAIEVFTSDVVSENVDPIRFSAPAGDGFYDVGEELDIEWELNGVTSVNLYYKRYNDTGYELLASNLDASTTSFDEFIIPDFRGDSLLFKLESISDSTISALSGIVRIAPIREFTDFNVEVISGGEFLPGSRLLISWAANLIDRAQLFYKLTSEEDYSLVGLSFQAKSGSYDRFRVPDAPGDSLILKLVDIDNDSIFIQTEPIEISSPVSNSLNTDTPTELRLTQNYPNPFNPSTQIRFSIPKSEHVQLSVFDVSGREVADLLNETKSSGWHQVTFDASQLSSGMYFYQLRSTSTTLTRKMLLMK